MQEFQKIVSQITSLLDKAKTKNVEFIGIRMVMDEMKKWEEDNLMILSPPKDDYGREIQLNYATLTNFQRTRGKTREKYLRTPSICAQGYTQQPPDLQPSATCLKLVI
jgi:hypothetical protein